MHVRSATGNTIHCLTALKAVGRIPYSVDSEIVHCRKADDFF